MAATFFSFFKQHPLPSRATVRTLLARPLSWYGIALYTLCGLILVTVYLLLLRINNQFLVTIPTRGGTVTEGVIGAPHVINPILATTQADLSLTDLIYSGLVRIEQDGTTTPVLARSYTISPDGLTYTFTLRDKLKWSDGKALTAADVAFTISKLSDPLLDSDPYWRDIKVSTGDAHTVVFTLSTSRSDFLNHTAIGIIPEHIWGTIPDESFETASTNLHPIGSGPFAFEKLKLQNGVVQKLLLKRNRHFALDSAYLDHYSIIFYANQNDLLSAINTGAIDMTLAATPETAAQVSNHSYEYDKIGSPRVTGVFRLRTDSSLSNTSLVESINQLIDKQSILATVEHGYGILTDNPSGSNDASQTFADNGYSLVNGILQKNGIPVTLSIAVENDPSILTAAQMLGEQLTRLGIVTTFKAFDHGTFQDAVRAQSYPLFLVTIRDSAIPASYSAVLELYTQAYPYIHRHALHIPHADYLDSLDHRYDDPEQWYVRTNKVWKFFVPSTRIINNP